MSDTQLVICELGGERYGLDIARVYEIIRYEPVTAVPAAPAFVEGVINLRGRIVPVVDLAARFGLDSGGRTGASRIVVAETSGMRVGLVVDGVSEVLMVADEAVEQTPQVAGGVDASFLRGIAKLADSLVILLDLDALFDSSEQTALGAAA